MKTILFVLGLTVLCLKAEASPCGEKMLGSLPGAQPLSDSVMSCAQE